MKVFWSESKFILIIFLILSIIAIVSNIETENNQTSASVQIETQPKPTRSVASIPNEKPKLIPTTSDNHVLAKELFCSEDGKKSVTKKSIKENRLVMKFSLCKALGNFESIHMVNESNGFRAQIFKLSQKQFKTDYVQLSVGLNKIKIQLILKDGQIREEWLEIISGS